MASTQAAGCFRFAAAIFVVASLSLILLEFPSPPTSRSNVETRVQKYWVSKIVPLLSKHFSGKYVIVDSHNTVSIPKTDETRPLKPDLAVYPASSPHSDYYLAIIGEIKPGAEFSDENRGQVAEYAQAVLRRHPFRQRICAFLASDTVIQFFQFSASDRTLQYVEYTPEMPLHGDGFLALWGLLSLSPSHLGILSVNLQVDGEPVLPGEYLGSGSSAVVYSGLWKDQQVVIKFFYPHQAKLLHTEKACLQKLKPLAETRHVPTFLVSGRYGGPVAEHDMLLYQPVGVPVFTAFHRENRLLTCNFPLLLLPLLSLSSLKCCTLEANSFVS